MNKRIPGEPALERQQVTPLKRPVYTFTDQPDPTALRQMAVRCMHDQLDIMWKTPKDLIFTTRPGIWMPNSKDKTTAYLENKIYHGLPYVRAGTALPQWYEFYDTTTGVLDFPGDGKQLWLTLGHSCASCVVYSWYSVCNSLGGKFAQRFMVPKNGCLPVAPLKVPEEIESYLDYSTGKIIEDNGKDVLFEAYANVQAADALNTQPNNHVMMAITSATVVRNADGIIDPDRSFIMIQDQRSGEGRYESGFYEYLEDGTVERYSGRCEYQASFRELCDEGYIPLTTAEFMGTKPYEQATATFDGNIDTLEGIVNGKVTANYPICVLKVNLFDHLSRENFTFKKLLKVDDIGNGLGASYPMILHEDILQLWAKKESFNLKIEVVLSNNQTFCVVDTNV